MVRRAGVVVVVGLFLCAAPAQAVTIVGPPHDQRWANRSHVPTPNITVTIDPDVSLCQGAPGCSYPGLIFGNDLTRHVFLYELGHEFDYAHAPDYFTNLNGGSPLRAAYEKIRGLNEAWWGDGIGVGAYGDSPGELFADDYAFCAETDRAHLALESRTMRRTCALIRRVGRR